MNITLRVNIQKADWCVYTHHTPMNELLYVGFDRITNAFKTHHLATNMTWIKTVADNGGDIIITVVQRYPDKTQAMLAAQKMRNANDPISQRGGKRSSGYVRRIDTNVYYISGAVAAKMHMISSSAMSNHLNGVKGYDKVHGLQFERLLSEPPSGVQIVNKLGQTINTPTPKVQSPTQPSNAPVLTMEHVRTMFEKDLATPGNCKTTDWNVYLAETVADLTTKFGWIWQPPQEPKDTQFEHDQYSVENDKHPPLPWFNPDEDK